jgi:hypothetical protein
VAALDVDATRLAGSPPADDADLLLLAEDVGNAESCAEAVARTVARFGHLP